MIGDSNSIFLIQDGLTGITEIYWATEQKCHQFTRLMAYFLVFNSSSLVMALNYAIYCICIGNMDTSTWNLPFNMVVPFNTESLCGWLLYWLYQLSANLAYTLCISMPTMYFAGFCRYIVAICMHFELLVDAIRSDVERIQSESTVGPRQQSNAVVWCDVRGKLFQLIDHHVNALE